MILKFAVPGNMPKLPILWAQVADGLTSCMECCEDNLLNINTVTASGEEEAQKLKQFIDGLDPDLRAAVDEFPMLYSNLPTEIHRSGL